METKTVEVKPAEATALVAPKAEAAVVKQATIEPGAMVGTLVYRDFQMMQTVATAFALSGAFKDATGMPAALVKMMAGRELGLEPVAAMRSIYMFDGQVGIRAEVIAAKVRQLGYRYTPIQKDAKGCILEWRDPNGKLCGGTPEASRSSFTEEDAKRFKQGGKPLADKDNYKNDPESMYFWRALTRGQRMFVPEATNGIAVSIEEIHDDTAAAPVGIQAATEAKQDELKARLAAARAEAPEAA